MHSNCAIVRVNVLKAMDTSLDVADGKLEQVKATVPLKFHNFFKQYAAVFFPELGLAKGFVHKVT